ncbi:PrsW family intramembrane metalloprotease [Dysgonomonas sp. OttesenSCG-928-M03]|nr:PrsW family intramembrane metalloprotease [Dysgonomonas sp. OttesenSCG-928-M03]
MIYKKDTIKESWILLAKCFFGGVFLAVIFSLAFSLLVIPDISFTNPLLNAFYNAFFGAAIPEEIAKFVILYFITWNSKKFDQYYDGIIYAVYVSLGFALTENIFYVIDGGFSVALGRAILSVPGHGFFGIAMGYYYSIARFSSFDNYNKYLALCLLSAIALHGIYDFILMYAGADSLSKIMILLLMIIFTVFIILLWRQGFKKIKKHIEKDKALINSDENQEKESTIISNL